MKKIIRIIVITIISIISIYTLFLTEESIRLQKGGRKPLILLKGTCDTDKILYNNTYETTCNSIGFKIKRKYVSANSESDVVYLVKEEFWLFDKFLIWGWIS